MEGATGTFFCTYQNVAGVAVAGRIWMDFPKASTRAKHVHAKVVQVVFDASKMERISTLSCAMKYPPAHLS